MTNPMTPTNKEIVEWLRERLDWIEHEAKGNVFEWIKIYPITRIVGANPNAKDAYETLRAAIDAEIAAQRQKEGK